MAAKPSAPVLPGRFDAVTAVRVGILAVLFVLLHWRLLDWMVASWWTKANWSHGFLLPVFSLYLIYTRLDDLLAVRRRPCGLGLAVMIAGIGIEAIVMATPLHVYHWLIGMGMITTLFGLVLYLAGKDVIRVVWLPVLYLALAVPIPEGLYTRVAYPLQNVAARGAVVMLQACSVDINGVQSSLQLWSRTGVPHELTVAEACSGMRLLMAFLALGVAMAYVETRPVWQRVILVGAGVPIAILCNVFRVAITCSAYYFDHPELGQNVLHKFAGMLMLAPAFGMLFILGWILNRVYVSVDDDDDGDDELDEGAEISTVGSEG